MKKGEEYEENEWLKFCQTEICCLELIEYEGWNFNSGNYLFTTDTK